MTEAEAMAIVGRMMTNKSPVVFETTIAGAWLMISTFQLTTRHPGLSPEFRTMLESIARQIQAQIASAFPEADAVMEMGWRTDLDVEPGRDVSRVGDSIWHDDSPSDDNDGGDGGDDDGPVGVWIGDMLLMLTGDGGEEPDYGPDDDDDDDDDNGEDGYGGTMRDGTYGRSDDTDHNFDGKARAELDATHDEYTARNAANDALQKRIDAGDDVD